jgi:hypothetical protein
VSSSLASQPRRRGAPFLAKQNISFPRNALSTCVALPSTAAVVTRAPTVFGESWLPRLPPRSLNVYHRTLRSPWLPLAAHAPRHSYVPRSAKSAQNPSSRQEFHPPGQCSQSPKNGSYIPAPARNRNGHATMLCHGRGLFHLISLLWRVRLDIGLVLDARFDA